MTTSTRINIVTSDAQGYEETLSFYVAPVAFGAAVDLPTVTNIENLIHAIFGSTTPYASTSILKSYSVEVIQDDPGETGGNGAVGTNIAGKLRSGIGIVGPVGRNGQREGIEMRIPGLDKSQLALNPQDLNSIVVSPDPWAAIRAALHTLSYRPNSGLAFDTVDIMQTGVIFTGTRAPMRPR